MGALERKSNTAVTFCRHEALPTTQHFVATTGHMRIFIFKVG